MTQGEYHYQEKWPAHRNKKNVELKMFCKILEQLVIGVVHVTVTGLASPRCQAEGR